MNRAIDGERRIAHWLQLEVVHEKDGVLEWAGQAFLKDLANASGGRSVAAGQGNVGRREIVIAFRSPQTERVNRGR